MADVDADASYNGDDPFTMLVVVVAVVTTMLVLVTRAKMSLRIIPGQ